MAGPAPGHAGLVGPGRAQGGGNRQALSGGPSVSVHEDDNPPLLTAEEEMRHQRALWINRLLKEQLAVQTQGLSIKEIEEAQAQIQGRLREAMRMQAWPNASQEQQRSRSVAPPASRSMWSRTPRAPSAVVAHSALNRRKRDERIQQENHAFLRRLESVKSTFTPRVPHPRGIPLLSPRSRLLGP
mmetsp:Transcript_49606/g.111548  ORF Transcript_49606/g.111548 Transcript_49606/m.111548 type:complete len:185 (+) Transcript_49606:62-616(+)